MAKCGAVSKRKAAEMFGIPKSTPMDKLAGQTPEHRARPGPSNVLTAAEENALVEYCTGMASISYPVTLNELCIEVKTILDCDGRTNPFPNKTPYRHWFNAFKSQHTELSLDINESLLTWT
ncbi:hypothetical protein DPMN_033940 [Dreissena polymorpha]|uniref:HTH psq-type domain-containing protein n=1 Tax=Dreissena polymorpha TaxID=45954 RepID=A0A9D4RLL7_DREPO|nr:hypothetical protein DPMN_033940 [Dreissena polymorpha]